MINNGLMFGMEGPNMEGTWYNPKSGDSFTVRNSFFQDNQYIVQTTDGRILDYNVLKDYIQTDADHVPTKSLGNINNRGVDHLPAEVADLLEDTSSGYDILPEDAAMLTKPSGSITNPVIDRTFNSQNSMIIEKALAKKPLPDLQVKMDWPNFPAKEIDMLCDIMDIPSEEIVDWYMGQIDKDYLIICFKEAVKDYLGKQLKIQEDVVEENEPEPKPKPKPKSKKKS